MLIFNLVLAVVSWVIVIAIAVANGGELSRHPPSMPVA